MLTELRKHSKSFVVKILFFLLIASFAVWGVGDMVGRVGTDESAAIKVGDVEVGTAEIANRVRREINRLRPVLGDRFGMDEAKALGLVENVIQRAANDTALLAAAHKLGVSISDDLVRDSIRQTPAFQGIGGFDRNRFQSVLYENNLTESGYIAEVRAQMARNHLLHSFGVRAAPRQLAEFLYRYRQEKRVMETAFLADSVQQVVSEPDAAELEKFHKTNAARFTAPEYRTLTLVRIDAEDLAAEVNVTEAEIKSAYEGREDEFNSPETRHVFQMILPSQEEAERAVKALTAGQAFEAVAKDVAKMDPGLVDIGVITKTHLPFPEVADAVFSLEKDKPGAPVKSPIGWHVFKVTEIKAGEKKTFDQVRDALRKIVAHEKAVDSLFSLANRFEDALGGGATLEEAAKKLNLKFTQIAAIDSAGLDPAGKKVEKLPPGPFISTAFGTDQNANSALTDTGKDGYFIVRVDKVTPPVLKPLDSIKDAVIQAWKAEKRTTMAKAAAESIVARINDGSGLDVVAKDMGLAVKATPPMLRNPQPAESDLPPTLINEMFAAKPGKAAMARGELGFFVGRLKEIIPADPAADKNGVDALSREVAENLELDVLTELAAAIRDRQGVSINRKSIDEFLTGESGRSRPARTR